VDAFSPKRFSERDLKEIAARNRNRRNSDWAVPQRPPLNATHLGSSVGAADRLNKAAGPLDSPSGRNVYNLGSTFQIRQKNGKHKAAMSWRRKRTVPSVTELVRVEQVLERDRALCQHLGPKASPARKRSGEVVYFAEATVAVAQEMMARGLNPERGP
jgi:hypothetical protein